MMIIIIHSHDVFDDATDVAARAVILSSRLPHLLVDVSHAASLSIEHGSTFWSI